jgi:hypothetical protein
MKKSLAFVFGLLLWTWSASAQSVGVQFDGDLGSVNSSGRPAYRDHPDGTIASSGAQLLQVTGQDVQVYDYTGKLLKSTPTGQFIVQAGLSSPTTVKVSDPRAIFDPIIDRFIFVCSCPGDYLIVSASHEATGPWKGVILSGYTGDLSMRAGYDKNGVYISEFQPLNTAQWANVVFALPSSDVAWSGAGNVSLAHLNEFINQPYDIVPGIDSNPKKLVTDKEYLVARDGPQQVGHNAKFHLLIASLTWNGAIASLSPATKIPAEYFFNTLINDPQPAPPNVKTTESYHISATQMIENKRHLYVVVSSGPCVSRCGAQGTDKFDVVFIYDIVTNDLSVSAKYKVSSVNFGIVFPALNVDMQANLGLCAFVVGPSVYGSPDCWWHKATDKAGVLSGPLTVIAGTNSYPVCANHSPVGWPGNYTSLAQDPMNGSLLWGAIVYGKTSHPCAWQTRVFSFQMTGGGIPEPRSALTTQKDKKREPY